MKAFIVKKIDVDAYEDDKVVFVVLGEEEDARDKCRELNKRTTLPYKHAWEGPIECSPTGNRSQSAE